MINSNGGIKTRIQWLSSTSHCTPKISKIDNKLFLIKWNYKETKVTLKIDNIDTGLEILTKMYKARISLESYAKIHPQFLTSFIPIDPKPSAPEIALLMSEAAFQADVGPFASVAGALIDLAIRDVDTNYLILENGGEIYFKVNRAATVGIYAGSSPLSGRIILTVKREDCPLGLGTSSATVGHAVSFGEADAATVIAENVSLADAASTAVCNTVEGASIVSSLKKGITKSKTIKGVKGVLIIREHHMIAWGDIPKLETHKPMNLRGF